MMCVRPAPVIVKIQILSNCAGMRESVRYDASSAAAKVLHHLGVTTLTFASDLAFGVLFYLVFQPTMIAGSPYCGGMHRYSAPGISSCEDLPTTTANPCNRTLHSALDPNISPVAGYLKKSVDNPAIARSKVLRCRGTE